MLVDGRSARGGAGMAGGEAAGGRRGKCGELGGLRHELPGSGRVFPPNVRCSQTHVYHRMRVSHARMCVD